MKRRSCFSVSSSMLLAVCSLLLVSCEEDEPSQINAFTGETVEIPGGTFTMGSPESEPNRKTDEMEHMVTLASFKMSKYEVTNSEYAAFLHAKEVDRYGYYPGRTGVVEQLIEANTSFGLWYSNNQWVPVEDHENFPVINVTWFGAAEFAEWVGGRLPREAEWEYACRANTSSAFNTGDCLTDEQGNYAWSGPYNTCTNSAAVGIEKPQEVGSYPPNAFGLHDMHGNVWEWCSDTYGGNPDLRAVRGGSWYEEAWVCRSANRHGMIYYVWLVNGLTGGNTGFRVAFDQ